MDNSSDLIKIIIADDHAIFRAGIIKVLNLDSQFQIIGEAGYCNVNISACLITAVICPLL